MATLFPRRPFPGGRPRVEELETRQLLSGQALVGGTLVRSPAQDFVAWTYEDVLHRPVDAAGLGYWSGQLERGVARAAVVSGIMGSAECVAGTARACYQQCLGREADAGGLAWLSGLAARDPGQARAELFGSAEYFASRGGGSDAGFVRALYADVLGREPDAAGAAYFAGRLAGGASRVAVAREVLGSDEACRRIVADLYASCLHRPADAGGLAYFTGAMHAGATEADVGRALLASEECWAAPAARTGDGVTAWNDVLLGAVRADKTAPPKAARALAILNAALADAVGPLVGTGAFHLPAGRAPAGASADAAAAAAGYEVLQALYPAREATFAAARDALLARTPGGAARSDGEAFGRAAAAAVLGLRAHDGSDQNPGYTPGSGPGAWLPTPPAYAPALLPGWGAVTPFTMTSGSQFRPAPPAALDSAVYADALAEVRALGEKASGTRTSDQAAIATFWADGGGTFTPPGHWVQIARTVALARHNTLGESARLFGALGLALADAGIAAWDAKYVYNFWRPVTALNQPGDPAWAPLLVTPPFPGYVSGHSTFSGAAETVLTAFYPGPVSFTSTADDGSRAVRSFTSFRQAADEAGRSRIYGGIHFEFDNQAGLASGRALGSWVAAHYVS